MVRRRWTTGRPLRLCSAMALADFPRYPLTFGPSPVHPLTRLTAHLGVFTASQRGNRKLRDIAAAMVEGAQRD